MFSLLTVFSAQSQRQARVGYIDMDYILSKLPAYIASENNLDKRVSSWQTEIAARKLGIASMESSLEAEKVLLTPILIEEKQLEIQAAKASLVAYQQQRFGVNGDLAYYRKSLLQPIQDLVFETVQKLGKEKGYDLILDKSDRSTTILFANKRFDLSDLVIRALSRQEITANMSLTDDQINEKEGVPVVNEALEEKQQEQLSKQQKRAKQLADKKAAQEKLRAERQKAYELRKQKLKEAREKKKSDKLPVKQKDSIPE